MINKLICGSSVERHPYDIDYIDKLDGVNGRYPIYQHLDYSVDAFCFSGDGYRVAFLKDDPSNNTFSVEIFALQSPYEIYPEMSSIGVYNGTTAYGNDVYGLALNGDGTAFYFCANNVSVDIVKYTMSTAYDPSTASFSATYQLPESYYSKALCFSTDGYRLYHYHALDQVVYQVDLSTPYDIASASPTSTSLAVGSNIDITGISVNSTGTKLWIGSYSTSYVAEYAMSSPWEISTASLTAQADADVFTVRRFITLNGMFVTPDSGKLILLDGTNGFGKYTLSGNISTATYDKDTPDYVSTINFGLESELIRDMTPNSDGTKLYLLMTSGYIRELDLSTAFDLTTVSYNSKFFNTTYTTVGAMRFNSSGTVMYLAYGGLYGSGHIRQYNLSTAWDISTAYSIGSLTVAEPTPRALMFNNDGTKFYCYGVGNDKLFTINLSTAWNISTGSPDYNDALNVATIDGNTNGIYMKEDGTHIYINGVGTPYLYDYELTTPYDVTTATFVKSTQAIHYNAYSSGLTFINDGLAIIYAALVFDLICKVDIN